MNYLVVNDIDIRALFVWTGNVSTDWNTAGNWDRGTVPGSSDIVYIPTDPVSDPNRFPFIPNGVPAVCYDLRVASSGLITVQDGGTLHVISTEP